MQISGNQTNSPNPANDPRPRKILLVDDWESDRRKAKRTLQADPAYNFEVLEAETGENLPELYRQHQPDLILLDYGLPGMNGLEILRAWKNTWRQSPCPIILSTGCGGERVASEAIKLGAADYVNKESIFTAPELFRARVRKIIERHEQQEREHEAKESQRENQDRQQFILEAAQVGTWEWDLFSHEMLWNEAMERLTGNEPGTGPYYLNDLVARIHPNDRDDFHQNLRSFQERQRDPQLELRLKLPTGQVRWILMTGRTLFDDIGRPKRRVGIAVDITEKKTAQCKADSVLAQTWKQIELLQAVLDNAPLAIMIVDASGKFTYANPHFQAWFGSIVAKRDFTFNGELLSDFYPDPKVREAVTHFIANCPPGEWRTFKTKVLGVERFLSWTILRLSDGSRVGIARDETDRMIAMQAMGDSEAYFRGLADAIPQLVWIKDGSGNLLYANRRTQKYLGLSIDQIRQLGIPSLVHPEDLAQASHQYDEAFKAGIEYALETRIRHHDGEYRWNLMQGVPHRDSSGQVTRWFCSSTDIHEQRLRTDVLQSDHSILQSTMESGLAATWSWNLATGRIELSENHHKLYGLPPGSRSLQMNIANAVRVIHPDDREKFRAHLERVEDPSIPTTAITYRVIWPDGSLHWLESRVRIERDTEGHALMLRGLLIEVTTLQESKERLRHQLKMRDDLLSMASHELRTPLTSLRLQTQLLGKTLSNLEKAGISGPNLQRVLEITDRQITRLNALVDDLLDASRCSDGRIQLQPRPMDFTPLLDQVLEAMTEQLRSAQCTVTIRRPSSVPSHWDPMRIEQVLMNLLNNSCKYAAGRAIHIEVEDGPDTVRIGFKDEGPGIPREATEKVFERFERATAIHSAGSLGLGLYLVRQIITAHSGTIELESDIGKGAHFRIILPKNPFPGLDRGVQGPANQSQNGTTPPSAPLN